MDIITSTKSCALDMEHNHKENEAETLIKTLVIYYRRT